MWSKSEQSQQDGGEMFLANCYFSHNHLHHPSLDIIVKTHPFNVSTLRSALCHIHSNHRRKTHCLSREGGLTCGLPGTHVTEITPTSFLFCRVVFSPSLCGAYCHSLLAFLTSHPPQIGQGGPTPLPRFVHPFKKLPHHDSPSS